MKKLLVYFFFWICIIPMTYGQKSMEISKTFEWSEENHSIQSGREEFSSWKFIGALYSDEHPTLPFSISQIPLSGYGKLSVEIVEVIFTPLEGKPLDIHGKIGENLQFETALERQRNQLMGKVIFCPIIRNGQTYEGVERITIRLNTQADTPPFIPIAKNKTTSVLNDGDIYKIAVHEDGIHKLSYGFLKDELGIPLDNVDPRTIKVYGNGGGLIPVSLDANRIDDVEENQIFISGESDGRFDASDYLLFYGQGPDRWFFNETEQQFEMEKNFYEDANYYFIKISPGNGLRVGTQGSLSSTEFTTTVFDDYQRYEEDKVNPLHDWNFTQGSGQLWFGDHFKIVREYDYREIFNFPELDLNQPVKIKAQMAIRATQSGRFRINIQGQSLESEQSRSVTSLSNNETDFAKLTTLSDEFLPQSEDFRLQLSFPHPSGSGDGSEGWLDFIQINAQRQLTLTEGQLSFRNLESSQYNSTTFEISGANDRHLVWDITNPLQPDIQEHSLSNGTIRFGQNTQENIRQYVLFDPSAPLFIAEAAGKVENQNLHGLNNVEMIILYHSEFQEAALQLAQHRSEFSDLSVATVRIDQVYNEFSTGRQDPTAIRDFAKMLYDRNPGFKYLLLFGDGSFDPRNRYELGNNFIPVYERNSLNPLFAFPSDDYYGLLSDFGSSDPLRGALNIAIGRMPVTSLEEALAVVKKVIHYETSPATLGDWRNRMVFIGDDEDNNTHIRDANIIADQIGGANPSLNVEKIYLDAFPQVATPGDDRFPAVSEAINQAIFKGSLVMTYLGHGGSERLAQEAIIDIPTITSWENFDRQPLFMTATCSFTGYDDAGFTTAGEELFLNPRGGAVALMTTVRAVYASLNADLTELALAKLFDRAGGDRVPTLGEAIQRAKNSSTGGSFTTNSRKFTLIGDPAMYLAAPQYQIQTTFIDEKAIEGNRTDTLRALQRVKVKGQVTNANGIIQENFNGILFPTVYDKKSTVSTLGQDPGSRVMDFKVQKNILFKGRVSVENGQFEFSFVVPKDINYSYGPGKISYYASDEINKIDAAGSYENIVIGGTSPDAFRDDEGPLVKVFMNTTDFVFGGITNAAPTLLVKLSDDNGINVVGNSIGHDLEAILDEDTQNSFLLNDFYESELDDFTQGKVKYPLNTLEDGRHTIRVKAWDVANNSAEGYTEFVVASSDKIALEHVLNYPNPFTDYTCFQFDHNLVNQEMDVLVQVYTISGRLVKTLEQSLISDGAIRQDNCIGWDGKDDFGDHLARGVYLYKVKVRAQNTGTTTLTGESSFEKLVILK